MNAAVARRRGEDELQRQLRDLLCLAVVGDHLRCVVTGDGAAELDDWVTAEEARRLVGDRLITITERTRYRR